MVLNNIKYYRTKAIMRVIFSETIATRIWLLIIHSIAFLSLIFEQDVKTHDSYTAMMTVAPLEVWSIFFALAIGSQIYGLITHEFSKLAMLCETLNPLFLWVVIFTCQLVTNDLPAPFIIPILMSLWLTVRYPVQIIQLKGRYLRW